MRRRGYSDIVLLTLRRRIGGAVHIRTKSGVCYDGVVDTVKDGGLLLVGDGRAWVIAIDAIEAVGVTTEARSSSSGATS